MSVERVAKRARLAEPAVVATTGPGVAEHTPALALAATDTLQAQDEATPATQPTAVHGHPRTTDKEDPMVFFSEEIALHILELLTPAELGQCACVSRQWYRLVNDQMLWRRLFYKDQFIYPRGLNNTGRIPQPQPTGHHTTATTNQGYRNAKRKRHELDNNRHRHDERLVYGDPSSNPSPCWKALYRLNHNWIAGQAQVTSLSIQQLSQQDQLFFTAAESLPDRDTAAGVAEGVTGNGRFTRTHSPMVQFQGPVLLIVSPGDMVHLWKIKPASRIEAPDGGGSISPLLSPSSREPEFWQTYRSSRKRVGTTGGQQGPVDSSAISCLALDRSSAVSDSDGWQKVMVGYDSGHFSIFEYLLHQDHHPSAAIPTKEKDAGLANGDERTALREIGNTADLPAWSDVGRIQSASFLYPILTTCSDDGTISIYKIQEDHQRSLVDPHAPRHWCRLLHRLYGSSPLSPVEMELKHVISPSPPPSTSTNFEQEQDKDTARPRWRVLVTFGIQRLDGSWTVRLQEIEFDEQFICHSIETGVEDEQTSTDQDGGEEETYLHSGVAPSSAKSSSACLESAGHARIGDISAITISSPYIVTTHPDNTMNVFHMARASTAKTGAGPKQAGVSPYSKPVRFRHLSTLYGHCGAVSSVAIESRSGRLVSASMDRSIKVWTMIGRNQHDQIEQRRVHQCSLSMSDLNKSWTQGAQVNKEEGLGLVWVGSDDEKIVSMNCDGTVKVWLFS
ncbi:hypothetical protein BGX23_008800 [Mortierella sp. AD031]|nr:hypothetical protein BGX23_008800 [Mortierella sp. AD031]